jgi:hypothetical protein
MTLAVRLNGTSDIPWESEEWGAIPQRYPDTIFYDYTKSIDRVLSADTPDNYHLTFSRTEDNMVHCLMALSNGHNVAVVFDRIPIGHKLWGYTVINGDADDLRFLDPRGPVIVGLSAKGAARRDKTGFVFRATNEERIT